ncbi:MAG TPA: hypothetical protein VNZ01_10215 [Solirubrobacteraceae bacterium]|nr:hypothetical protein [Solirubrobacteraceae bacterium]
MRELLDLRLEGRSGAHLLGERFAALALSDSLSQADMARAAIMTVADVDAIIAERVEHDARCNARAAEDRVARHRAA